MKKKLTKRQTAVAIAKDVLKQLKAKQYIATSGTYIEVREGCDFIQAAKGELQKILKKEKPKCNVCAIGSALLSAVRLTNDFKLEDNVTLDADGPEYNYIDRVKMTDKLEKFFTQEECFDMEGVFECSYMPEFPDLMALEYDSATERLVFVMREIIRQKGHFDIKKAEKQASKLSEQRA